MPLVDDTDVVWPPDYVGGDEGVEWIQIAGVDGMWISKPLVGGDGLLSSWWAHRSPTIARNDLGRVVFGEPHHRLVSEDPIHIEPSLLCLPGDLCGLHGFIRDGRWVPA